MVALSSTPAPFWEAAPSDAFPSGVESELLPADGMSARTFEAGLALYRHHAALVAAHRPERLAVPLAIFWASANTTHGPWATSSATVRERVIEANHFTIVRPPAIDEIAAVIREDG